MMLGMMLYYVSWLLRGKLASVVPLSGWTEFTGWGAIEAGRLCREQRGADEGEGKREGQARISGRKICIIIKRMFENVWPASFVLVLLPSVCVWQLNEIGTLQYVYAGGARRRWQLLPYAQRARLHTEGAKPW